MLSPSAPGSVPIVTGTVQVVPLPVGVPIDAPVAAGPVSAKLPAFNPVILSLKVTV